MCTSVVCVCVHVQQRERERERAVEKGWRELQSEKDLVYGR